MCYYCLFFDKQEQFIFHNCNRDQGFHMAANLNNTEAFIFQKLPIELLFYLASRYLDYSSAVNFMEVLILKNFKLQTKFKSMNDYTPRYYPNLRFLLYRQLISAQLIAGKETCFYFSPKQGWYVWGKNPFPGETTNALITRPQKLKLPQQDVFSTRQIKMIASRNDRTFFLTANGVYMTDSKSPLQSVTFNSQLLEEKVVQIALGANHALALTNTGKVYSWGDNQKGQLGLGDSIGFCNTFRLIYALQDKVISKIFTGDAYSFCITADKKVYAFGDNNKGQLGIATHSLKNALPTLVEGFSDEKIKAIAASIDHTLFLTETGRVYSCGSNHFKKLGFNHRRFLDKNFHTPILIQALQHLVIDKIAAGKFHSLCLTTTGQLYGFGSNVFQQLDNKIICSENSPSLLDGLRDKIITNLSAGDNHALCLDKEGKLYSFGNDCGGVLGRDADIESKEVTIPRSGAIAERCRPKFLEQMTRSLS